MVTAQLAAARSGTQSTKTRAEVAGGGAKPFKQKGTGRARQGSTRSPQWVGGGIALGPKPRSYRQRTPKKMIRLALNSALSDRASEGRVALIDEWSFAAPRTKDAVSALSALELTGRVLVVIGPDDGIADRSFANLQRIQTLQVSELNAYDILKSDWIVFTDATVPGETESAPATAAEAPARRASAAKKAAATEESSDVVTASDDTASDDTVSGDTGSDDAGSDDAGSDDAEATDEGSDQ